MTAFLNNIITFFFPVVAPTQWRRRRIERVQMRRVIVSAAWGGWTEGGHENGGDRSECVICRLFNTVVQAILCAHRVSPTPPRDHQPRVTLGVTATLCPQRKSRTPIIFYVSYRRIIQAYYTAGISYTGIGVSVWVCVCVCGCDDVLTLSIYLFILFFCKS